MPKLRALWTRVSESLWFVPSLILLTAIVLAVVMVELSAAVDAEVLARWPRVFGAGADGSRSMLSAIASSMITVAGVTFSITMVAVTQASTQYTPRILRNFMRDRANQAVLGTFVGIFAYCVVVLRTIRGEDGPTFVPSLAVLMGIVLALVGVGVLIFFVHHIATTLQASEIVARITDDTRRAIDRLYPDRLGGAGAEGDPEPWLGSVPEKAWSAVLAPATGYVQHLGMHALTDIAEECDLLVRIERVPGDFVVRGQPVAWFASHPAHLSAPAPEARLREIAERSARHYVVGTYRTLDQDAAFGMRQLVDIALKALSPGINDTTTAVTCVDYLGAIMVRLADCRLELVRRGEDGVLRVVAREPTFESLLALATDEIRQASRGNVSVLARQLQMLTLVARVTHDPARRRAVAKHIALVQGAATKVAAGYDLERLQDLAGRALLQADRPG
ncbi:MAG TPA: DUF2254 domain-containing protein [Gemmatimonadales bacterium]